MHLIPFRKVGHSRPRYAVAQQADTVGVTLPITYRTYQEGDEISTMRSFNETFDLCRTEDYWRWKFGRDGAPIALLAVDAAGCVQAQWAGMRTQWHDNGLAIPVAQIGDMFARRHPDIVRGKVMLKTLTAFHRTYGGGHIKLLYGFPNRTAAGLHSKRFPIFESAKPITTYLRPVDGKPNRDFAADRITRRWPTPSMADDLWQRAAGRYGVAAARNFEWLNWRFRSRPDVSDYRFLGCTRDDGAPSAWMVLRPQGDTLWICDLLWDGQAKDLRLLDDAVGLEARTLGLSKIGLWLQGDAAAASLLSTCGWTDANNSHEIRFVMHLYDASMDVQTLYSRLYLTYADSDLI